MPPIIEQNVVFSWLLADVTRPPGRCWPWRAHQLTDRTLREPEVCRPQLRRGSRSSDLKMAAVYFAILVCCSIAFCVEAADPKPTNEDKKVVCYYTNWSYKRAGPYAFTPDKIDPFLCTHIIYAFIKIGQKNNLISSDPEFDFNQRGFANATALKKKNKNLKVMIGVGGWVTGTLPFMRISSNETNRREFAKNAVRFIRGYMFDGIDLNWQHPGVKEGGSPQDKENYVKLAQTLREEFEVEAVQKNKPKLLLSISIAHHEKFLPGYDIASFNTYMDFISVICYDYHFSYESAVNHHSPLYSLEEDSDYNYDAKININYTINYFKELADPAKLVLGIPVYGRTYKLENTEDTALGSYADGPGDKGPGTGEKGFFAYFEICNFVKNEGWTVMQTKPGSAGPYAYKGDQWVCYDDLDMIRNKVAYANKEGLSGVMFWTIDYDDFDGKCQDTKFPLIRTARDALYSTDMMVFPDDGYQNSVEDTPSRVTPTPPVVPKSDNRPVKKPCKLGKPQLVPKPTRAPTPLAAPRTPVPHRDEYPAESDVSEPQSNIVGDLIRLIQRAGGMTNFCNILKNNMATQSTSSFSQRRAYNNRGDSENTIVFESPNLPPILVALSNSSIYIKEINVFQKS
ncbi:chitinase-3-like protein 1 isoform X3 [Homalodisca vitripennis]|uniref:chitinase-3-like protein 1 isoform X3 n=1 Tax=Homalodisca vitripennis TaxID=197043 RepID=UPI001EEBF33C|nr:chitinase-3-like protein 1 isoform X3 [Homalodisca vitripennis]